MRGIACKACFEFGGETFEALVIGVTVGHVGKYSTTACMACKAQHAEYSMQSTACKAQHAKHSMCNSAKHVLIVEQFVFVTGHLLASLHVNQDVVKESPHTLSTAGRA